MNLANKNLNSWKAIENSLDSGKYKIAHERETMTQIETYCIPPSQLFDQWTQALNALHQKDADLEQTASYL